MRFGSRRNGGVCVWISKTVFLRFRIKEEEWSCENLDLTLTQPWVTSFEEKEATKTKNGEGWNFGFCSREVQRKEMEIWKFPSFLFLSFVFPFFLFPSFLLYYFLFLFLPSSFPFFFPPNKHI